MSGNATRRVVVFIDVDLAHGGTPNAANTLVAFCRGRTCERSRVIQRTKRCGQCLVPLPGDTVEAVALRIARGEA